MRACPFSQRVQKLPREGIRKMVRSSLQWAISCRYSSGQRSSPLRGIPHPSCAIDIPSTFSMLENWTHHALKIGHTLAAPVLGNFVLLPLSEVEFSWGSRLPLFHAKQGLENNPRPSQFHNHRQAATDSVAFFLPSGVGATTAPNSGSIRSPCHWLEIEPRPLNCHCDQFQAPKLSHIVTISRVRNSISH